MRLKGANEVLVQSWQGFHCSCIGSEVPVALSEGGDMPSSLVVGAGVMTSCISSQSVLECPIRMRPGLRFVFLMMG